MKPPRIYAIHDQALTIAFAETISGQINALVIALQKNLETAPLPGQIEVVPSYSSLTVYFDQGLLTNSTDAKALLLQRVEQTVHTLDVPRNAGLQVDTDNDHPENCRKNVLDIPVCYDATLGADLHWVATHLGMLPEEVAALHASTVYRVYMMGFIPGFPYMGTLPVGLQVPRKQTPSMMIPAGSVAIAGKQTGMYPAAVPGGWQVIGRTPLKLFDANRNPACLLKAGDLVQFRAISKTAFDQFS